MRKKTHKKQSVTVSVVLVTGMLTLIFLLSYIALGTRAADRSMKLNIIMNWFRPIPTPTNTPSPVSSLVVKTPTTTTATNTNTNPKKNSSCQSLDIMIDNDWKLGSENELTRKAVLKLLQKFKDNGDTGMEVDYISPKRELGWSGDMDRVMEYVRTVQEDNWILGGSRGNAYIRKPIGLNPDTFYYKVGRAFPIIPGVPRHGVNKAHIYFGRDDLLYNLSEPTDRINNRGASYMHKIYGVILQIVTVSTPITPDDNYANPPDQNYAIRKDADIDATVDKMYKALCTTVAPIDLPAMEDCAKNCFTDVNILLTQPEKVKASKIPFVFVNNEPKQNLEFFKSLPKN
jgi:hypothetical protein